MSKVVHQLSARWDLITGRFRVFFAERKRDVDACIQVLEEVRRKELNRVVQGSVLESHAFGGQEVPFRLAACEDTRTGQIVGCVRVNNALEAAQIPGSRAEYILDNFDDATLKNLRIFTRLAVLRSHRKTPASLVLLTGSFSQLVPEGCQAGLFSCEPNLFPFYLRLGLRPYGPHHTSPSGGFRIPMICILDRDYLKEIGSPALRLLADQDFDHAAPMQRWYRQHVLGPAGPNLGFSLYDPDKDPDRSHAILTRGLSQRGTAELLQNAITLQCRAGDVVVGENDGGKAIGIVQSGSLEVRAGGRTVAHIRRGEVFGELAFAADSNRSAALVAESDQTRVLLLSAHALQRFSHPQDELVVWRALARIIARRLIESNHPYRAAATAPSPEP